MEYVLTAQGLCKKYGKFTALNDFSIHVPKGSVYGLIGKNGAGKTTLIRIICGLQEPTKGDYTLLGAENGDKKIFSSRRRTGALIESPAIYHDLTVRENLKQQYRILGLPSFEGIDEIVKLTGLSEQENRKAGILSLGMRQRLAIGIALCSSPDFLILDEPVNGLDPEGIIEIRELILKLNREKQVTFLISSHILGELSKVATCYGFIDKGKMIKEISAKELSEMERKCLRLEVNDTSRLSLALESTGVEYEIVSDTTADVFGEINITELTVTLAEENCIIKTIQQRNETLESYYINLLGGDGDEKAHKG